MSISDSLKRGTGEILLLTLLHEQDMYGYQLLQELNKRSKGLFVLQEASMYAILYRLQHKGFISSREELVGQRLKRIYYHLEENGLKYLKQIKLEYLNISRGVNNVIENSGGALIDDEEQ